MNRAQRKIHLVKWLFLTLLLPVGYFSAILVIPEQVSQKNIFKLTHPPLNKALANHSNDNFIAMLRADNQMESFQLEIIITRPFQNPSISIYLVQNNNKPVDEELLIGKLNSKGILRFPLPGGIQYENIKFVLYDPIHENIISEISF